MTAADHSLVQPVTRRRLRARSHRTKALPHRKNLGSTATSERYQAPGDRARRNLKSKVTPPLPNTVLEGTSRSVVHELYT
jgi:hypothetical protein